MGFEFVMKSMAALVVIIVAANYLIKQLNRLALNGTKHLRIIERMPLSKTSSLYIVEVQGKYYLMSVTEQRNDILKELDGAAFEQDDLEMVQPPLQGEWLNRLKEQMEKRKGS